MLTVLLPLPAITYAAEEWAFPSLTAELQAALAEVRGSGQRGAISKAQRGGTRIPQARLRLMIYPR